nr:oxidoreductase C-terminal domain-containing protein [Amaricoccus macauensis]
MADYAAVPWFWSDQGDRKLQIAGLRHPGHRTVVVPGDRLVVLSLDGDVLKAVETVNAPAPHMAARRLLAQDRALTAGEIEAAGFDLVALAKGAKV